MAELRRTIASAAAIACLMVATPAYASDMAGIIPLFFALYGGVLITVWATVFGVSYAAKNKKTRSLVRWLGLGCGLGMTAWWILGPFPEGPAFLGLFLPAVLFLVLIKYFERPRQD
jgi:hypothetical protein